jgi:hypothetical protein
MRGRDDAERTGTRRRYRLAIVALVPPVSIEKSFVIDRSRALRPVADPVTSDGGGSIGSVASCCSIGSVGSILSIGSAGSILSIGSAGSVLSIGSAGSILSFASAGSVLSAWSALSVASVGSVASVSSSGSSNQVGGRKPAPAGADLTGGDGAARWIGTALAVAALVSMVSTSIRRSPA